MGRCLIATKGQVTDVINKWNGVVGGSPIGLRSVTRGSESVLLLKYGFACTQAKGRVGTPL